MDKTTGLHAVIKRSRVYIADPKTVETQYPAPVASRGRYRDAKMRTRSLVFLALSFDLPALKIANIYKCRWQVELFFRWIKQHLRIKVVYGTSPNAVKTQVWIAICIYVLVAIIRKKELRRWQPHSLHEILQILSVSFFAKTPINKALSLEKPRF